MRKIKIGLALGLIISLLSQNVYAYASEVGLVGVTVDGHDHTTYYASINEYLNTMGYADSTISLNTDPGRATILNLLDTCEIVVTRSHGGYSIAEDGSLFNCHLVLQNGAKLYYSDIETFPATSLSNLILAVYIGCRTALGGISLGTEDNLVVATSNQGARTAVGFTEAIDCNGANSWVDFFFENLANGDNIDVALNSAVEATQNKHWILEARDDLNIDSCRYRGEWNYTFVD